MTIHSSFCLLNFMLPACRLNFAEFSRAKMKVRMTVQRSTTSRDCDPSERTLNTHIAHQMK